ncbi:enoyl-CoA hydratase [Bacillus solimangrovi]|uniref:Enoyl-CoA hydratase n=1 Tax=Bacillus solimangrovi TaxID=1305675 RepID=A0A1E5LJY3_9BACI|nr:enoyl-CoA hydratase [Bacillus solimangrovi]OEH94385.1 enoyl-CoA hydratase [Bacillus solimangrovi]
MVHTVQVEKSDSGIITITLNRPESANAFSKDMLFNLHEVLTDIKFDTSIRCVIITGAGERIFCAGADLKERSRMSEVEVKKTVSLIRHTMDELESLPMPVIAAINGAAFGGGLELALSCDIRIASDNAKVGLTETSLAIIPGAGGTQRLTRLIGKGRAKELIFTAARLTANEAVEYGIIEHITSQDELLNKANEIAEKISNNGPIAVRQAKLAINRGSEVDLQTGLKIEEMAYAITIPTKDRIEGLQAFKEKRKPNYKGE